MSTSSRHPPPPEIQGEALSSMDRFWLETARNAAKESIASLEEAAKQSIAIVGFAQTVYFAAISFSDVKEAMPLVAHAWWWTGALVLPLVCWIASLWFAILVFKPQVYATDLASPDLAREVHTRIVEYKRGQLQRAYYAMLLGFVPLLVNLVIYLALIPAPPKSD